MPPERPDHRWIIVLAVAVFSPAARAQSPAECYPNHIQFNVCDKAREIQAVVAAALPMQLNTNITMSTAAVDGPLLILTAQWRLTKEALDASLAAGGMPLSDLAAKMAVATHNSVCAQPVMAAFVRLGGQIRYTYRTIDGVPVLSPTVTDCPKSSEDR